MKSLIKRNTVDESQRNKKYGRNSFKPLLFQNAICLSRELIRALPVPFLGQKRKTKDARSTVFRHRSILERWKNNILNHEILHQSSGTTCLYN